MFKITKNDMTKITEAYPPRGGELLLFFEEIDKYYFQTFNYDEQPYSFSGYKKDKYYPTHWIALKPE